MTQPMPVRPGEAIHKISVILLDSGETVAIETRDRNGNLCHLFEEKTEVGMALWARLLAAIIAKNR